jgi:hypothetical protein
MYKQSKEDCLVKMHWDSHFRSESIESYLMKLINTLRYMCRGHLASSWPEPQDLPTISN